MFVYLLINSVWIRIRILKQKKNKITPQELYDKKLYLNFLNDLRQNNNILSKNHWIY